MEAFNFSSEEKSFLSQAGVEALVLFGSQAQGIARANSDYDVAVLGGRSELYDVLYDLLSKKINQLINIDIVFLSRAPLELKSHVSTYGRVLYERSPNEFADFRQRVMIESSDFAPLQEIFSGATLSRISP